jgi:2-C-methyl-D-erythritol 4-phosphate cytidylyltransferase
MAADQNKVLLELAGKPVLLHSVETFRACCHSLVIVAAAPDVDEVCRLVPDAQVVAGGATRHGSEWNGLKALRPSLSQDDVLAIHDAARPLVARRDVEAVFAVAEAHGAAMLATLCELPALEVVGGGVSRAYSAAELWRAQTPQASRAEWLLDAYDRAAGAGFDGTDTAAVLAFAGYGCQVVAAGGENPKITVPGDLAFAEGILKRR